VQEPPNKLKELVKQKASLNPLKKRKHLKISLGWGTTASRTRVGVRS
jgi:hypothetical protein